MTVTLSFFEIYSGRESLAVLSSPTKYKSGSSAKEFWGTHARAEPLNAKEALASILTMDHAVHYRWEATRVPLADIQTRNSCLEWGASPPPPRISFDGATNPNFDCTSYSTCFLSALGASHGILHPKMAALPPTTTVRALVSIGKDATAKQNVRLSFPVFFPPNP